MSQQTSFAYEFGPFRLVPTERLLFHGQDVIPLKPKVFDTLLLLIENRGRLMGKDELMQVLWPDSFVEENSLVQNISMIRRALSESNSTRRYVETIPKRGYRFVAEVRELNAENGLSAEGDSEGPGGNQLFTYVETQRAAQKTIEQVFQPVAVESVRTVPNDAGTSPAHRHIALALVLLFTVGIAGFFITLRTGIRLGIPPASSTSLEQMHFVSLTSIGKVVEGSVSPDGRNIAYVAMEEAGRQSVWLKQIETDSSIRIVPPEVSNCIGLTFSPDGNHIFYTTYPDNSNVGVLFQVALLGGTKRLVLADIDSPVSFSPDGNQLAFLRRYVSSSLVEHRLMIANVDGSNERLVSTRKGPDYYSAHGPAWSPDGKTLVTGAGTIKDVHVASLVEVSIEYGHERSISPRTWSLVERVAWLQDGSGLIVIAADDDTERLMQIWHVSYAGGETRRVTKDLNHYHGASLSSDSTKLVTVQSDQIMSMWVSSDGTATNARELTLAAGGRLCGPLGVSTTPDHKIVYSATGGGNTDIWIMNGDGTEQRRLTYDEAPDFLPSVSPDGSRILFLSNRTGTQQLWTMGIDGYRQTQLTTDEGMKYRAGWSPDGKWIVYAAIQRPEVKPTVWKVSAEGGAPVQVTKKYSRVPTVSPDGKLIACYYWNEADSKMKVAIVSIDGGEPIKLLENTYARHHWSLQWAPDGRGLLYVQTLPGSASIWRLPLNNDAPEKVLQVPSGQIIDFTWSRDGKQFVYTRAVSNKDLVSITGFRQ